MPPTAGHFSRELSERTQESFLKACVAIQIVGLVGCTLMLGTAIFSKSVHRHTTWFSFVFSWVVSGVCYLLLFFSGQLGNQTPPFGLCLAQAALIYSVPILTAASTLGLVTQVYFNIRNMFSNQLRRRDMIWTVALLVIPYIMLAAVAIGFLILGLNHPETVHRSHPETPYCNMVNRIPSKISSITVATLLLPTLFLEFLICMVLRKNWEVLKSQKYSPSTAIRLMGFSFCGVLAVGLSLLFAASNDRDPELTVVIALMPTAAFLIFGTQEDILAVWMFWRKRKPISQNDVVNSSGELRDMLPSTSSD